MTRAIREIADATAAQAIESPRSTEARDPNSLLRQTQAGRPEAFGEFYRLTSPELFRYFRRRCGGTQDAYDLVAETFAEVLRIVDRFDPAKGDAVGWMYGIAANKWRRYARSGAVERRARQRMGVEAVPLAVDEITRLEELVDLRSLRIELDSAMGALPADMRAAVLARVVDGEEYSVIAARSGVREAAVRKRVSRGLAVLAVHLAPRTAGTDRPSALEEGT